MSSDTDPVLELGRSLADSLDPSDVAGRWMSHHLAELILRCEAEPQNEQLVTETRELIMKVWEHKDGATFRRRPMQYLEPVFSALERLEPDRPPWTFYGNFPNSTEPTPAEMRAFPLLRVASDMEQATSRLVRLTIAMAGEEALGLEQPWVVTAIELASTEQDLAIQQMQRLIRRVAYTSEPHAAGLQGIDEPCDATEADGSESATKDEPSAMVTTAAHTTLEIALRSSLTRCRSILDQLDAVMAEQST